VCGRRIGCGKMLIGAVLGRVKKSRKERDRILQRWRRRPQFVCFVTAEFIAEPVVAVRPRHRGAAIGYAIDRLLCGCHGPDARPGRPKLGTPA